MDVRLFKGFIFALRFHRVSVPAQRFRVCKFSTFVSFGQGLYYFFTVSFVDGTDLCYFRTVRRVTLRRSRFHRAISRSHVFRHGRIGPTAATFTPDCDAVFVSSLASLTAYFVGRFYQGQATASAYAVDFRSAVRFASIAQKGPRAYATAYAGHVKEDRGQVEARVGVRRHTLYAFNRGELAFFRVIVGRVFTISRAGLFRVVRDLRPLYLRFDGVVFVVREARGHFVSYFYDYVLFVRVVRRITCTRAIATSLVHVDQASAFANHASFT